MHMTNQEYNKYVASLAKKSPIWKDLLCSFLIGGVICALGQLILNGWGAAGLDKDAAAVATAISLVFLSAVLTGLSWYDDIAKIAGAGTIVPITGFANSMVSPALEYKREGYVLGVGAKLFTIAGPVLVYGISTSVLVGLIYFILNALGVIQL